MFERLVVSTVQRRKHTTAKFFFGTVVFYAFVIGCAFIFSVLFAEPKLAAGERVIWMPPTPPPGPPPPGVRPPHQEPVNASQPNLNKLMTLDDIAAHQKSNRPPTIPPLSSDGASGYGVPGGLENGVVGGAVNISGKTGSEKEDSAPPRPADPPKPQPRTDDKKPVPVPSSVLQGKAIERVVPVYPEIPKRIHLQGEVSVEVVLSPEGRVESARVVSGHPLLVAAARDAALRWRFSPTILNGVPVRVTGVITFVFKMNE
jgi:protein TonB